MGRRHRSSEAAQLTSRQLITEKATRMLSPASSVRSHIDSGLCFFNTLRQAPVTLAGALIIAPNKSGTISLSSFHISELKTSAKFRPVSAFSQE